MSSESSIYPRKVLLKLIVIGESGVGKTALLNHYINNNFVESHKPTIGADFFSKEIKCDNKLLSLQLWDTAGQERFKSLSNSFYRGADAAIIVYDITDKDTFDKVDQWKNDFLQISGAKDTELPMLLLGNKSDLSSERVIDSNMGKQYAQQNDMVFYETSAMNGNNIKQAVQDVAVIASQNNSAVYFPEELIEKMELAKGDGNQANQPSSGSVCACQLL